MEVNDQLIEQLAELAKLEFSAEEKSGIKLSLSTLKRLWKKDYDQTPHPSTLQALVSLLGYKDWQEFKLQKAPVPASLQSDRKKSLIFFLAGGWQCLQ